MSIISTNILKKKRAFTSHFSFFESEVRRSGVVHFYFEEKLGYNQFTL